MPDPLVEQLNRDMECEHLLECFHGLAPLDRDCFEALAAAEDPLTVDDLAAAVDRERSTAYRALQRLQGAGLVRQEQVNYDDGGYYHVYEPTDPERVAAEMERLLGEWHARMDALIGEFETRYADAAAE
jgi:predicted transcriptional regulator